MPTFQLRFKDEGNSLEKTLEFQGETAAVAFGVLEGEMTARHVELWTEEKKIAEITRDYLDLWQLDFELAETGE